MDKEIGFKRSIFEKFPWLNLVLTILVTILQITMAITDGIRGKYLWMVFFILMGLTYIFLMIPMSYKMMKRTIQRNKEAEDLERRINEVRRKWKIDQH